MGKSGYRVLIFAGYDSRFFIRTGKGERGRRFFAKQMEFASLTNGFYDTIGVYLKYHFWDVEG